jgi:UPF0716 family protein affecting phage T7 exclusion
LCVDIFVIMDLGGMIVFLCAVGAVWYLLLLLFLFVLGGLVWSCCNCT